MNEDGQTHLFQNDLSPNIRMLFDSLCCSPSEVNTSILEEQIKIHIQKTYLALESNEFLDVNLAQQAATLLIELLSHLGDIQ